MRVYGWRQRIFFHIKLYQPVGTGDAYMRNSAVRRPAQTQPQRAYFSLNNVENTPCFRFDFVVLRGRRTRGVSRDTSCESPATKEGKDLRPIPPLGFLLFSEQVRRCRRLLSKIQRAAAHTDWLCCQNTGQNIFY